MSTELQDALEECRRTHTGDGPCYTTAYLAARRRYHKALVAAGAMSQSEADRCNHDDTYGHQGMPVASRVDVLLEERGKQHGDWSEQARITNSIKNLIRSARGERTKFSPELIEALDMIATKLGRIAAGDPFLADHYADIAGYARLAEKWLLEQKVNNNAAVRR